jgi:hypothetical protein
MRPQRHGIGSRPDQCRRERTRAEGDRERVLRDIAETRVEREVAAGIERQTGIPADEPLVPVR